MGKTISVTNDGDSPRFVMGMMIPPGETRTFEEHEAPPELRPDAEKAPEAPGDDPLLAVSALSVGKLATGLPALSDDELLRLEALEQAKDKPRQGALAAITAERLRRAEAAAPGGLGESTDETAGEKQGDEASGD